MNVVSQDQLPGVVQVFFLLLLGYALVSGRYWLGLTTGLGVVASLLPGLLERRTAVRFHPLALPWLALAVILHFTGVVAGLYTDLWWWDHVTHTVSAGVLALIGHGLLPALEDREVRLPAPVVVTVLVITVTAAGVVWEMGEGLYFGGWRPENMAKDLLFTALGGLAVGLAVLAWQDGAIRGGPDE